MNHNKLFSQIFFPCKLLNSLNFASFVQDMYLKSCVNYLLTLYEKRLRFFNPIAFFNEVSKLF